jgi:glycosyltransferase involved in cell wall biosynthesis
MRHCHIIDALSKEIRDNLIKYGIAGGKVQVAPCSFTDLTSCQPAPQKKPWVVFLGRLIDTKNPLLLAKSIPRILGLIPDVRFFFLGAGYLGAELEEMLLEQGIVDRVTLGFEPDPIRILNHSSIFVSLQTNNNYPSQSLLEAMACGNAVVATDVGETWRLVDEANGIRVPPTVDAVAEAIVKLLNAPNLADLGRASRKRVLDEHTAERFYDYITGVYRMAAGKGD